MRLSYALSFYKFNIIINIIFTFKETWQNIEMDMMVCHFEILSRPPDGCAMSGLEVC